MNIKSILEDVKLEETNSLPLEYKDEMLQVATLIGKILSFNYED